MTKRVVLKLDGSISQGLKVTAEVGMEGEYPQVEFHSKLTPNPNLEEWINYWQQMYRSLDLPTRLVLKKVIYNKPIADQIQECSHWSYRFGEVFKEWLNGSDFSKLDKNLRSILNFDETIHFLIRFEDIKIAKLPWYLWDFFEMFKHAEIAFGTPTYRKRCFSQRAKSKRLQLLAILGDSSGIDVRADQTILNAFGDIDTKFLVEPQFEDLQNHLWSHEWDIVFFAGHSQTEGRKGRIRLNSHDALDIHFLKNALGKTVESGLQLFIANSCDGLGLGSMSPSE